MRDWFLFLLALQCALEGCLNLSAMLEEPSCRERGGVRVHFECIDRRVVR